MKRASDGTMVSPNHTSRSKERISSNQESVKVYCRLRPLKVNSASCCIKLLSENTLSLTTDSKSQYKDYNYVFRRIFSSYANQKEVFQHAALPLVKDLLDGKDGLLFTYGITGSGKTYTLTGEQANPGIIPQSIHTLFNSIGVHQAKKFLIKPDKMNGYEVQSEAEALEERKLEAKSLRRGAKQNSGGDDLYFYVNNEIKLVDFTETNKFAVFITYVEIYNNAAFDLLDESTGKDLQSKIIRKNYQNNMYVSGAVEKEVKSVTEAFEVFNLGQKRKRMAQTVLNADSSRSHSIFSIRLVQIQTVVKNNLGQQAIPDRNLLKISQLSLVDLAGSERCNRTQNTGTRLKEAGRINNSLMTLRTCLEILRENQITGNNKLVPYRDSRLTLLFKNYFEGEGHVRMIICVNPSVEDYEENIQVLKFAEITQEVKTPKPKARYTPYNTPKSSKKDMQLQTPRTLKAKKSYSFGPKFPTFKLDYDNVEDNKSKMDNFIKLLKTRKQKIIDYNKGRVEKELHFRKRLVEINEFDRINGLDMNSVRTLLKKEKCFNKNSERKIEELEVLNNNLISKNNDLQETVAALQDTIQSKNLEINQNFLACEVGKKRLAVQNEKLLKEHEEKLRKQDEQHKNALKQKIAKLQKVKTIINSEESLIVSSPIAARYHDYQPQQTPPIHRRNRFKPPNHRRSRSADEVWVEHNTVKPTPLATLLQPAMKKRKSLTHLKKATDITNSKQSKYCLIAQETQSDGEMETKLYKGDILPTYGGGAQVVFNEVEKLKQVSPIDNK